jgi:DNA-binding phage protein
MKITRWDVADYLETKDDIVAYLDAVLEDGDPELIKTAIGDVARAKGMTEALSLDRNPEFTAVARVLKALGLRLSVAAT